MRMPPRRWRAGVIMRMLTAWRDLPGSMRAVLAERPGEGALLAMAMLSGLLRFLGRLAGLWLGPGAAGTPPEALLSRIGAEFAGALVFRTLALYAVALLLWGLARLLGGRGGVYATRATLFWAALVAAPVMLMADLAGLAAAALGGGTMAAGVLGGMAFALAAAHGVAAAHGLALWRAGLVVLLPVLAVGALGLWASLGVPSAA